MPRMNSIMERWVQTCRRELLDRTLIWNQAHLLHGLREFEHFYNKHRPHQGIASTRTLHRCPSRSPIPTRSPTSTPEDTTASAADTRSAVVVVPCRVEMSCAAFWRRLWAQCAAHGGGSFQRGVVDTIWR